MTQDNENLFEKSWYVSYLITNRDKIRQELVSSQNTFFVSEGDDGEYDYTEAGDYTSSRVGVDVDLYNDTYSDLLSVEQTLDRLIDEKVIPPDELVVARALSTGKGRSASGVNSQFHRHTTRKLFNRICARVAFVLGEHFPDSGYVEYMKNKYNLSDKQVELLIKELNK